jgi:hypothetical protein
LQAENATEERKKEGISVPSFFRSSVESQDPAILMAAAQFGALVKYL